MFLASKMAIIPTGETSHGFMAIPVVQAKGSSSPEIQLRHWFQERTCCIG